MYHRRTPAITILLSFLFALCELQPCAAQEQLPAPTTTQKGNSTGLILTIGAVSVAAASAATWYLLRRAKQHRLRADTLFTTVETAWDSAAVLFDRELYRRAVEQLQVIPPLWDDYRAASQRYHHTTRVNPDSIATIVASSTFLETLAPIARRLTDTLAHLPTDEHALSQMHRLEVTRVIAYASAIIDSILQVQPEYRTATLFACRHITNTTEQVTALLQSVYPQKKLEFSLKNKYYYNQALSSADSSTLRTFVADCDYYQCDKEWCERARLAHARGTAPLPRNQPPGRKTTAVDSMNNAFRAAMESRQLEQLEAYITRFSMRKYRRLNTRIDSARIAVRLLRQEIQKQMQLNETHPLFTHATTKYIDFTIKGLSHLAEEAFVAAWSDLRNQTAALPSIRLPAALTIDYTLNPPLLLFDATIAPEKDCKKTTNAHITTYALPPLVPVMELLNNLKQQTIEQVQRTATSPAQPFDATAQEMKKINFVAYTVRFRKPDNSAITLYAKAALAPAAKQDAVEFYPFYDLISGDGTNHRFSVTTGTLPNFTPAAAADTLERTMGLRFFSGQ